MQVHVYVCIVNILQNPPVLSLYLSLCLCLWYLLWFISAWSPSKPQTISKSFKSRGSFKGSWPVVVKSNVGGVSNAKRLAHTDRDRASSTDRDRNNGGQRQTNTDTGADDTGTGTATSVQKLAISKCVCVRVSHMSKGGGGGGGCEVREFVTTGSR
jgi:hypothetical protein